MKEDSVTYDDGPQPNPTLLLLVGINESFCFRKVLFVLVGMHKADTPSPPPPR